MTVPVRVSVVYRLSALSVPAFSSFSSRNKLRLLLRQSLKSTVQRDTHNVIWFDANKAWNWYCWLGTNEDYRVYECRWLATGVRRNTTNRRGSRSNVWYFCFLSATSGVQTSAGGIVTWEALRFLLVPPKQYYYSTSRYVASSALHENHPATRHNIVSPIDSALK
jgi:hypothetical protein